MATWSGRAEGREHGVAVERRLPRHGGLLLFADLALPAGHFRIFDGVMRQVILAAFTQRRAEDFRVPAAAGPDFDHGHPGPQPEKKQGFARMAVFVAQPVGLAAMFAGKRPVEQRINTVLRGSRGRREKRDACCEEADPVLPLHVMLLWTPRPRDECLRF
jgi:hypothetical protein